MESHLRTLAETADTTTDETTGSGRGAISLRGWSMSGRQGDVFADVDLDVPAGSLAIIRGSGGTGKTSLLLSLAGRMRVSAGTGSVGGHDIRRQARAVRSCVSVGHVAGLTDLEKDFTVAQHLAERLIMLQPWYKPWVSKSSLREVIEVIRETITSASDVINRLPADTFSAADAEDADFLIDAEGSTFVSDLSELQKFLLEFSLASLSQPPVIVLDNIDFLRERRDRARAWAGLLIYQELRRKRDPDNPLTLVVTCEDSGDIGLVLEALETEISPASVLECELG